MPTGGLLPEEGVRFFFSRFSKHSYRIDYSILITEAFHLAVFLLDRQLCFPYIQPNPKQLLIIIHFCFQVSFREILSGVNDEYEYSFFSSYFDEGAR